MTADAGEDVEKEEHFSTVGGIINWYNHSGNQFGFFRKLGIVLPEDPAIPLLGIYPEDVPTCNKDICSTMFIAALFIIAEAGNNPDVPQKKNGYRKYGTFTQWSNTQPLRNEFMKFLGK